jgi:hypothetical protein
MAQETPQGITTAPPETPGTEAITKPPVPFAAPRPRQVVTGVMPPQLGEATIREAWPTVLGIAPGLATLARKLVQSVILLPLGLLILAPLFLKKIGPFVCRRYTLTNRRLMIQAGLKPAPVQQVALADIDDVRLDAAAVDPYYLSGTLEVVSKGQVVMTLPGVPEPEGFRQAILNAVRAWVPGKEAGPFQAASAVK